MFSAPQTASSRIQNANGARASTESEGVRKSVRPKTPTAPITTAVMAIITAETPSTRSTMPSGGAHPPSR
jgi:hypothetical protein